jgi:hypothetical protein
MHTGSSAQYEAALSRSPRSTAARSTVEMGSAAFTVST